MFLWPYILFLHKESYLTILMFLDYSIVTEYNYEMLFLIIDPYLFPGEGFRRIKKNGTEKREYSLLHSY